VHAAAEARSFKRAAIVLAKVGGNAVSIKTVARISQDVGNELVQARDGVASAAPRKNLTSSPEARPELAVVQCDGGRIRTRTSGQGPGVHGEAWRESKNACLVRMSREAFLTDPHPELPTCFCNPLQVAKIAEKQAPEPADVAEVLAGSLPEEEREKPADWRPKRLVRTCLSSLACSETFGKQMARESQARRFDEAPFRAFLGDGLAWNWTIWKQHYASYVPILDFIHPLAYLYTAALALEQDYPRAFARYLQMARACWQGKVETVIEELAQALQQRGVGDEDRLETSDPRRPLQEACRYLRNNRERMDYPRYRQSGLPVTTALMESLVKEINLRVKGTEMFWNDPEGAEAILQIRAAALCDDDRLSRFLATRPGSPYVRRSSLSTAA
jgi:hypothetical protein